MGRHRLPPSTRRRPGLNALDKVRGFSERERCVYIYRRTCIATFETRMDLTNPMKETFMRIGHTNTHSPQGKQWSN